MEIRLWIAEQVGVDAFAPGLNGLNERPREGESGLAFMRLKNGTPFVLMITYNVLAIKYNAPLHLILRHPLQEPLLHSHN